MNIQENAYIAYCTCICIKIHLITQNITLYACGMLMLGNEEQIIHCYLIDGAMVQGGCRSYRWCAYITTLLLQEASWLLDCNVEHPNCASGPSILLVLLEPH